MRVFHDIESLRRHLAAERRGRRIAFVPTMGALHRGHGACVAAARGVPDALVVASIFVNPAQFGPGEDFQKYPRTLDADMELLRQWSCDVLFAPSAEAMYPEPQRVWIEPGPLAEPLDGQFRPGHFRGVATVVAKLFNLVEPDVAVFVRQLAVPIELKLARTVREDDGLAVSSRNVFLSPSDREKAATLFKSLEVARRSLEGGERNPRLVEASVIDTLRAAGIAGLVQYASLRSAVDLSTLVVLKGRVILALAVRVGTTRLIDNMVFDVRDDGVHADVMLY
jgi:pantoate--beta-alanine ligase